MRKSRRHLKTGFWLIVTLLLDIWVTNTSLADTRSAPSMETALSDEIQLQLSLPAIDSLSGYVEPWIRQFYRERDFLPAWTAETRDPDRFQQLIQLLQSARLEGLDPKLYGIETVQPPASPANRPALAQWDIQLSKIVGTLFGDLHNGQIEPQLVDEDWHIKYTNTSPRTLLQDFLEYRVPSRFLQTITPRQSEYQNLRTALQSYLKIEQQGGWPEIPSGPLLKLGHRHEHIAMLRKRLRLTGDLILGPELESRVFDRSLAEAVQRFQIRHGLSVDGIVGPETRAALNVSAAKRVDQIRLGLERWRWMPRSLGERYVLVNLPGFELYAMENDRPMLSMRIIIGKPTRQTPSLSSRLYNVVINPAWNIPRRIFLEDLLPVQIRNPDYLNKLHIRVFGGWQEQAKELDPKEIDWKKINNNNLPYRLVQDPGPNNSLGRIKFLFSNAFQIYMHDTPHKHLFYSKVRTFSSGCIRIQKPWQMAEFLLGEHPLADKAELQQFLSNADTQTIGLPESVPIFIVYLTTWALDDGTVYFFKDIYGRDELLALTLNL